MNELHAVAAPGASLTDDQVRDLVARACPAADYRNQRVLLIIPDGTRTAPVGLMFQTLHRELGAVVKRLDILVALGTHQPMSEAAICERLEISLEERRTTYREVRFSTTPGMIRRR